MGDVLSSLILGAVLCALGMLMWRALRAGLVPSLRAGRTTVTPPPVVQPSSAPTRLPVMARRYLLNRSEQHCYRVLRAALEGTAYQVFPRVRLNDVFTITAAGTEQYSTLGRLRDKRVDFLIVEGDDLRPVLGIELEDSELRHGMLRDAVRELAFACGRLPLLTLDVQELDDADSVREPLSQHLWELSGP
ncbi:DUF2726 domain-containing protein [Deinococcus sonorensis]|uniref:DUF2726 domain-containing protein n=2 Tax=Deinococcus sonorensis TaxID=309891 RepID=A0AAU7UBT8_9DEIO